MKSSALTAILLAIAIVSSAALPVAIPFAGVVIPSNNVSDLPVFQNHLVGSWTNVTPLFGKSKKAELNSAFLQLDLRLDGTFTCVYGTKSKRVEETGTWKVSPDRQLLYFKKQGGTEVKVARIASTDEESLVLECLQSFGFCQFFDLEITSLAFIK